MLIEVNLTYCPGCLLVFPSYEYTTFSLSTLPLKDSLQWQMMLLQTGINLFVCLSERFSGISPRNCTAGSHESIHMCMFSQNASQLTFTNDNRRWLLPICSVMRSFISPCPCQHLILYNFLFLAILIVVREQLNVNIICIDLITNEFESLFAYLLTTLVLLLCISYSCFFCLLQIFFLQLQVSLDFFTF